jgi:uncharacterized protein YndB with AHSA1/START domain
MPTLVAPQPETAVAPVRRQSRLKTFTLSFVALLVVFVAAVLAIASTKPDTFRVERSVTINAPTEEVFPLIADFKTWSNWSPFEKLDPAMKKTHSGAATGQGAIYEWDGNSDAGKGRIEITEAVPASKIAMNLDFERPLECHNKVVFTLEPQGDATKVTWAMDGPNQFIGKVIQVFISMDAMVGGQFEEGLGNLKTLAEK